jgi:hypothetical protein
MRGGSIVGHENQFIHHVLRLDRLMSDEGDNVWTTAAGAKGSPMMVSSVQSGSDPTIVAFQPLKVIPVD